MNNNTILVTGGAGFIGSNFVLDWVESNEGRVVNLDLLTYAGNLENLHSLAHNNDHVFMRGDIGDIGLVSRLLQEYQPWAIVNFAAESHVDRSISDPGQFIQTNVWSTYNLLNATRNYWNNLPAEHKANFRFLHVSTDEVYGSLSPTEDAFLEITRYQPNSPYSASKAASDHLVRAWHHTYELPTLITNCSNNYGPYQFPEKLIPLIITNAISGQFLPIYGDGKNIRDWLFVQDHCNAVGEVLKHGKPGQQYNIGGNNEKANIDVVKTICTLLDKLAPSRQRNLMHPTTGEALNSYHELITFVRDRPGHDKRYAIDATKMRTELGWEPKETFESGIEKTLKWYLENTAWIEEVKRRTTQGAA